MQKEDQLEILEFIRQNPLRSSGQIHDAIHTGRAYATTKRLLAELLAADYITKQGGGRATKYVISPAYALQHPIDPEAYFKDEIDARQIKQRFNLELITGTLAKAGLFTGNELQHLAQLQDEFTNNVSHLSKTIYDKEFERLAIDLSWKSSQIEGNTYSLLETERLLKEREMAIGKPKDDAVMLLNHKEAIEFVVNHPDYVVPLSVSRIEDIHSILVKDLGINRNIRQRRVGISGTNYTPPDNEYQIKEALFDMCVLINGKDNIFEKALLALILLSYIQPFEDGNKRTARIVSNAILIANSYCPISFRTADATEYKKAMLIFYEQNNISAFKKLFINQFEFAVKTYF